MTEQTPPYVVRDVYGGPVLPETLGHVAGPRIPAAADPAVGAVQVGVRIGNRRDSLLARLQDMEFVTYTDVFQRARDIWGWPGWAATASSSGWPPTSTSPPSRPPAAARSRGPGAAQA